MTVIASPADVRRRRGLRRMRLLALSLLVLAAVVFFLTHDRGGGWDFVAAGSEAAMVGAIADWFAVTALFRHPLGLPIPHTAIIPRRKEALGQSLEDFVTENFLTEANARQRLASADVTRRFGRWLAQESNARRAVAESAPVVARGLQSMRDEEVQAFFEETLVPRLVQEDFSPVAGHLVESVVDDGAHHGLVDLALVEGHRWLAANHDTVAAVVGTRAPWWSPSWLDDLVIERIHREVVAWVADVRDRKDHPARQALDDLLSQLARDLQHDPDTRARADALARRVLTHPGVGPALVAVWDAIRTAVVEALADEEGALRTRLRGALQEVGERLVRDDALRSRVDQHLADTVGHVVTTYGGEIATVISQTVNRWDGKEAADRIELHVGKDLQFIRINGTVVGALAGLAIHTVTVLL
jgi:uncharacterized membrane-anchored protein YjiN (DUF445 family)